jgi:hypothetical protein
MVRVLPGKMAEYLEIEKQMFAIASKLKGMPTTRKLMRIGGKGDIQHTIFYEMEFDSPTAMEGFWKMHGNPEMVALMPRFDSVIESHEHEFYVEAPMPS